MTEAQFLATSQARRIYSGIHQKWLCSSFLTAWLDWWCPLQRSFEILASFCERRPAAAGFTHLRAAAIKLIPSRTCTWAFSMTSMWCSHRLYPETCRLPLIYLDLQVQASLLWNNHFYWRRISPCLPVLIPSLGQILAPSLYLRLNSARGRKETRARLAAH